MILGPESMVDVRKKLERLKNENLGTDMTDFKKKVKGFKNTVQKRSQEQIDQILSNVKSPALKDFLNRLNSNGEKGPVEIFRSLAEEQRKKIEKAADQLASRVSEVKEQGQKIFETELTQLLGKGVFERANKVRDSLKKTKEAARSKAEGLKKKVSKKVSKKTAKKTKKKVQKKKSTKSGSGQKKASKKTSAKN